MTVVYRTFKYVDSIDPLVTNDRNGRIGVTLMDLPSVLHSSTFVSVHALDIPVPNLDGYTIPRQLRIHCSAPTPAQDETGYTSVLLQLYPAANTITMPGDFSVISYRDQGNGDSTALQVLDPQFSAFDLYLTDGNNKPFKPVLPFDIVLKIELVRNYAAEQLEQAIQLVRRQELLLLQLDLALGQNISTRGLPANPTSYNTADDIYGPLDATVLNPA